MPTREAERYQRMLDEHEWLKTGICFTVIRPNERLPRFESTVRSLGGIPASVMLRDLRTDSRAGNGLERYFYAETEVAAALLEVNGFQGSRHKVLRVLSQDAAVSSAYWNVNSVNALCHAANGALLSWFDAQFPEQRAGEDPSAFPQHMSDLLETQATPTGVGNWQASSLATMELETGVKFDELWLDAGLLRSFDAPPM
jgi:hypothetical protein